jgi:hypothetical protein
MTAITSTEAELITKNAKEDDNNKMVLDIIVSRLLESGNLLKAERICMLQYFDFLHVQVRNSNMKAKISS